jgi:hypothetical protein
MDRRLRRRTEGPDRGRSLSVVALGLALALPLLIADGLGHPAEAQSSAVYYISPSGQDANDGRAETRPFKTFARAFSVLPAGGTLVLLDGTYSVAGGTGVMNWEGAGSAQVPSGTPAQPTQVTALHP